MASFPIPFNPLIPPDCAIFIAYCILLPWSRRRFWLPFPSFFFFPKRSSILDCLPSSAHYLLSFFSQDMNIFSSPSSNMIYLFSFFGRRVTFLFLSLLLPRRSLPFFISRSAARPTPSLSLRRPSRALLHIPGRLSHAVTGRLLASIPAST